MAYEWVSKRYDFGAARLADPGGVVDDAVQSGVATKALMLASYNVGANDRLRILVEFGKTTAPNSLVVLDEGIGATPTNLLNSEIDLVNLIPAIMPVSEADFSVRFRLEITTDYRDPDPESPNSPFVTNEPFDLYLYRNLRSQRNEVRFEPVSTTAGIVDRSNRLLPPDDQEWFQALRGVQTVFYFKGTRIRASTKVSDSTGRVHVMLPPAQYDVEFYGAGFVQHEWLTGESAATVGVGESLTVWTNSNTSGVAQSAEFGALKAQFSQLYWPGYVVAEDFSAARIDYRDAAAEGADKALQLYGRAFAGFTYVDFVGIAVDPSPE